MIMVIAAIIADTENENLCFRKPAGNFNNGYTVKKVSVAKPPIIFSIELSITFWDILLKNFFIF